ncbi:MAG: sigma-70 family RNA polymerase sigma factor [Chloroflexi bacterium]|nr:sigma-70 family RNA polymerase sigma factor [Chloroflexota bacterium]
MSDPHAELIARCQEGDTLAFANLVAQTQTSVYNLAYSVLHDREEAQDMTQEVYLKVWRALPSFRGESKFSSWLYRITINACLNRRRQLRKDLVVVDHEDAIEGLAAHRGDPVKEALTKERNEWIWAAVDRLAEKYRLVITLFYQEQLSYQEIAEMLSLPLGTIKAHLNRAREALAKSLNSQENASELQDGSQ